MTETHKILKLKIPCAPLGLTADDSPTVVMLPVNVKGTEAQLQEMMDCAAWFDDEHVVYLTIMTKIRQLEKILDKAAMEMNVEGFFNNGLSVQEKDFSMFNKRRKKLAYEPDDAVVDVDLNNHSIVELKRLLSKEKEEYREAKYRVGKEGNEKKKPKVK